MKPSRTQSAVTRALLVAVLVLSATLTALALNAVTWVSGVGDDSFPGSRTAPAKTFASALSKTTPSGVINCLDPCSPGTFTVTQSVTVDGTGTFAGVLANGSDGIIVAAGASDRVVLRNLNLVANPSGLAGIRFVSGGQLIVENCTISRGFQTGIQVDGGASQGAVSISNTSIHNCAAAGVSVEAGATATISLDGVTITNSLIGVNQSASSLVISNSMVTQNLQDGLLASAGSMISTNNVVAGNGVDTSAQNGALLIQNSNFSPVGLTLSSDTGTGVVSATQAATYNVTVMPPPGGFSATTTMSVSGLPTFLTAKFTPNTLPISVAEQASALTVNPAVGATLQVATYAFTVTATCGTQSVTTQLFVDVQ